MTEEKASPALLTLQGLTKSFGGLRAVEDVYIEVRQGSITSLIGPNGAGKTTVFNLVSGLLQPTSGRILYRDRVMNGLTPAAIARSGIGRTFQEPRAFDQLSVLENILVGFQNQKGEKVHHAILKTRGATQQEKANRERSEEILQFVGLSDRSGDLAKNLSHGQQRFLSFGRILASDPDLLLIDEPTVGLHQEEIHRLIELLTRTVKDQKRTILLIEHNMDVVMNISDEIHLLVEGKRIVHGKPEDIKGNPTLVEAFLGIPFSGN